MCLRSEFDKEPLVGNQGFIIKPRYFTVGGQVVFDIFVEA
jgi:hypothetical protein